MKLGRKQDLNAHYQVCVFRADRKNKMAAPASDWLRHFFDLSSETAERNSTKLDRKQDLNVLYQVCVFGPIVKTRWPPWPLIGLDIFDFSETAERNSTKLDRKQDPNVLYQVYVFGTIVKTRWPPLSLIGWDIFVFSSETFERNSMKLFDRKQNLSRPLPGLYFRADQ